MIYKVQYLKIILIVFTLFLSEINCNLIIPLKFIQIDKINETNPTPSSIMRSIIYRETYAEIELGTPKQLIQIPLTFYSNDLLIIQMFYVFHVILLILN